ncbi:MAG: GNAT family N-acetyltransferase [Bacteroidota bacterium]|jgi:GNAT superfamily N-acetyltransferase|nr:MAG: GNAT family N-acetyltransferase [Bacteroidota bacterium]
MSDILYNGYTISTDKSRLDVDYIHRYISVDSYWGRHIPASVVRASIANSFCVGAYKEQQQVGFARLITDYATFGYLADVFVDEAHRGRGLSKQIVSLIMSQPFVGGLRRLMLGTRDAHRLYARYGFTKLKNPDAFMEIHRPDIYSQNKEHG